MTERQRYIAALTFQHPDRVPFVPGGGRESTLATWRTQGLPPEVDDYHAYVRQLIGMPADAVSSMPRVNPGVVLTMRPEFEEAIIERRPERGTIVVQDWKGNVCEIADNFDPTYLRGAPDFVTRTWIKCPVASRSDWPDMARRYDTADPARFPDDFAQRCTQLAGRDYPVVLGFSGPFWQLREWLGFESLCMLLLDDPDFADEMIACWREFVATMLTKAFQHFVPDVVIVNEDMAYKEKPMIGPEMSRRFLLPTWRCWVDICRAAGVPVCGVDSDGYIGGLIPVWLEAGFVENEPLEVAAGNDLPAYRQTFGTKMAYRGGIDKRAIAKGGDAMKGEMARLQPVIDAGGYIPGCDHGIPGDVSWPNFVEYCRLLAKATGWLA